MTDKSQPNLIVTHEHTALYPNFEKPRAFQKDGKDQGDPKYGYTALFDKADVDSMKPLYKAGADAAKAKWPDITPEELQKILKRTFKDGDKEAERLIKRRNKPKKEEQVAHYRGKIIVKCTSKNPIDVSEIGAGGKPVEIIDWKKVYSGMKGRAEINLVAMDNNFNDADDDAPRGFVVAYCNFFLKTGDGKRLSTGGRDRNQVWAGVQGSQSQADPTKGADDDIPF